VSDQDDPLTLHSENSYAAAQQGGVAVGAVQVAGDVAKLQIGNTYVSETLTLRATPPAPPPHFTGREDDLAKFTRLLTSGQNVAITALQGMGGIGKTALAQKLAERVRDQFPGGVLWWTLGPSADVFTALDVWARHADPRADLTALPTAEARAEAVRPLLARLGKLCAIIDDVWDEAAARILLSAIPPGCPILITTRDGDLAKSLRCRVERIDALSDDEAVALLEKLLGPFRTPKHPERNEVESNDALPSTTPLRGSAQDAYGAACDIAHLTEALPLALELIAGIADSPADLPALARELHSRPTLDVLKRGKTREQSIEACFTMSYERLDADMQRRFRALGVFAPAPFDCDAIAAVWNEEGDGVDEAIKYLVRRSLLTRVSMGRSEAEAKNLVVAGDTFEEYHQHALLRDHALKLLQERDLLPHPPPSSTGEGAVTPSPVRGLRKEGQSATPEQRTGEGWEGGFASHHATYYRRFAQEQNWRTVEHFFDQIDHGWQWVQVNAPDQIINYVLAVRGFLRIRGRTVERMKWLSAGLLQARTAKDPRAEGNMLNSVAFTYKTLGQMDQALDFSQQALAICREVGDRSGESATLTSIGRVYDDLGQKGTALGFYRQALAIEREVGDRSSEGNTLNNIGSVYNDLGQIDQALDFSQQALAICREVGDRSVEGRVLGNIGKVHYALGQTDQALDFYQQALAICSEVGDRSGEGTTLNNIGKVYDALGQKDKALDFSQQALAIRREVGDRFGESVTLFNIGWLLDQVGRTAEAVTYLEQNVALDEAIGHPNLESDRAELERVRGKLGESKTGNE
jgi:tetratricopeptide (TPR) repeat protein